MTGERQIVPFGLRVELNGHAARRKNPPPLSEFPANFNAAGADLLVFLSSFIEALPAQMVRRGDRHFGCPSNTKRRGRTILLQLHGGESGRRTTISLKHGDPEHQRETSGVEREPFWVAAVVPNNSNQAWLLVEKAGRHTVPTEWRTELSNAFKQAYPGYLLKISPITELSLWAQVENSTDPRLLTFEAVMRDSSSGGDHSAGHPGNMARYDTQVWHSDKARQGALLRQFRRMFTRKKTPTGLVEIDQPLDVDDLSDPNATIVLRDDVRQIKARVFNSEGKKKTVIFDGREPQMTVVMDGVFDISPSEVKFWEEARSVIVDLAANGGVSLAPKWDTEEWDHPENAIKVEVSPSDVPAHEDNRSPEEGA
ncbi:hypothetical protein [Mycobacterium sp. NPDC004974]